MNKKIGEQTFKLDSKPKIIGTTSIVGPKEGEGPLKDYFDVILKDDLFNQEVLRRQKVQCYLLLSQML